MRFVETSIFTEEVRDPLEEEEYRALQLALLFRPDRGGLNKFKKVFTNDYNKIINEINLAIAA